MGKQTPKQAPKSKKSYYAVATSDVLDDERLTDKALRLYLHISRYANQEGYCWASNATLAEKCGCSARAVQRALLLLEACGHIFRDEDRNDNRRIWITKPSAQGNKPGDDTVAPHDDTVTEIRQNCHASHDENVTHNNTSLINKSNNIPLTPRRVEQEPDLEERFSPELAKTVSEWLAYKREKKQGYKPRGLKILLGQIRTAADTYGDTVVIEVIRRSMAANYQGIVWDRMEQLRQRNGPPSNTRIVEPEGTVYWT